MRACCPSQRKEFKCPKCGMEYNRDLNIARRLMMLCGMGELDFEPADEAGGVKPSLNAGSFAFKGGVAHLVFLSRSLIFS